MDLLGFAVAGFATIGHFALWVGAANRSHALAWEHRFVRVLKYSIALTGLGLPALIAGACWFSSATTFWGALRQAGGWPLVAYVWLCCAVALVVIWHWGVRRFGGGPRQLLSDVGVDHDLAAELGRSLYQHRVGRLLGALPGNETNRLRVQEKHLLLPHLPEELDGLTIAHLSDLHFTGRLERAYFEEVIRQTEVMQADLIAVTGDIIDSPGMMEWIPATLGRLQAPGGVFYILGNHDLRLHVTAQLRATLDGCGLVNAAGRWFRHELRGVEIVMAGNECPWAGPPPEMNDAPPPAASGGLFRLLLAHTPDQIGWARRRQFDLMLAGHTHGGQVCLPWIGPLVAPSLHGVRYAAGTFYVEPTLMHVSRGISGETPLRINCPPELTRLVLCREAPKEPA